MRFFAALQHHLTNYFTSLFSKQLLTMKMCTLGLLVVRLKANYQDYIRPAIRPPHFKVCIFGMQKRIIVAVFAPLSGFVFKNSSVSVTLRLRLCPGKQTHILFFLLGGPGRVVNGAFMVLKGHRSIVNQVRFNPHTYMICSSGVEKVIKVSNRMSCM